MSQQGQNAAIVIIAALLFVVAVGSLGFTVIQTMDGGPPNILLLANGAIAAGVGAMMMYRRKA